ncbi:restriction endonuclease subunit S [Paenibacillus sp. MMS18-CY102]|uniref:restriction endonuclease subunit S n=1 Tax=Paenibacillus sp. MMS18-CY102 TaxID=2682849 RepID=UPI0013652D0E|nr:restriction endonuclease subunit S [Paenibacillus sp. MMS18-CY102]MWC28653.1 restriction endonuclease subunit S [Paenibacillus sp. MMS18-CY102]
MADREQAYKRMLDTAAKLQWNVSMILEAKAVEAEKVRNWMLNHVSSDSFNEQHQQLKETMRLHDQIVEVIDGLTKLGRGMNAIMKVALEHGLDSGDDGSNLFGGGQSGGRL